MKNLILVTLFISTALSSRAFQTESFGEANESYSVDRSNQDANTPENIATKLAEKNNELKVYEKHDPKGSGDTTLRRNTIKLDLTSHWLYRNALVFSYERVTKPNQSFAISGGYQQFPSIGSFGDNIDVEKEKDATGYKFGGEYRFYLEKENKYGAPRGVYIGPYATYLSFKNGRTISVDNEGTIEQADLDTKLSVFNIGVQLGYQFVLNNRWTIDLIFVGPSVSNYNVKFTLDGNYTFDPDEVENEILADLIDRFPGLSDLLTDKEVKSNGKVNSWAYGYRYQFLIGYHFGRSKK
ncbi:MAG TPA: DUF3575 domain-containing protein [Cyclobacteriaceae bacterium]|nr:DUF3575 domain-containing protein [Cyclobacteriaceae bacterium]